MRAILRNGNLTKGVSIPQRCDRFYVMRLLHTLSLVCVPALLQAEPRSVSGIYPHLAMFNNEGECGTGAVVPWADRLWVITYAPHQPKGSSDKLYEITPALEQIVRPESIGGTPANRMIHRESGQLFIGPHAIDAQRKVRTIPYTAMFGRHTGLARHLTDPAGKIVFATMEEGIYEVDVETLTPTTLWSDEQVKSERHAGLPGYHGKGFYSSQGRYLYANNGDHAAAALSNPAVPSGVLAEWDGKADAWTVVRRNQFTEVTGPGGIEGSAPDAPVWSIGWDHRSLILMVLDGGKWSSFRLPKASHCYDGAHGWNTEWPRIRDIGEKDLLMTMHGSFWKFPRTFSATNTAGIAPRSTYLKVVGDFARWGDRIVLGCDDTAKAEFLNKRKAKGQIAAPQSHSNLWFIAPAQLDQLGGSLGRGAVWLDDAVEAGQPSDAYLFSGLAKRSVHLASDVPAKFTFEIDATGNGNWSTLAVHEVDGNAWYSFDDAAPGVWIRVKSSASLKKATAWFTGANDRAVNTSDKFVGLASLEETSITAGLIRARGDNKRTLHFAAMNAGGDIGGYDLDADLRLVPSTDPNGVAWTKQNAAIPARDGVLSVDAASVLYIDDKGRRFRLPKGDVAFDQPGPLGWGRLDREVATERDLFNCHGTFYELPAENAGGFARVRPVTTHNRRIADYCSYRGLLVISGISDAPQKNPHIIRSEDGRAALWVGAIDDIWDLGKPTGTGGPWRETAVKENEPSDPFLMTGYDRKQLTLSAREKTTVKAEVDITGAGNWVPWKSFDLAGESKPVEYEFPAHFHACWVRFTSSTNTTATAVLRYE